MLALTVALALVAADAVGEGNPSTSVTASARLMPALDRNDPVHELEPEPGFDSGSGAGPFTGSPNFAVGALSALSPGRLGFASANAPDEYGWEGGDEEERAPRLFITAWGGEAFAVGGSDWKSGAAFGGEVSYALPFGDLGLWGSGYKIGNRDAWAPIALLRLTNRFATGRGLEAAFTFGVGAGRPIDWRIWFQVALGVRLDLGPMFLAGELSFEQEQLLRLSGGLGVKL